MRSKKITKRLEQQVKLPLEDVRNQLSSKQQIFNIITTLRYPKVYFTEDKMYMFDSSLKFRKYQMDIIVNDDGYTLVYENSKITGTEQITITSISTDSTLLTFESDIQVEVGNTIPYNQVQKKLAALANILEHKQQLTADQLANQQITYGNIPKIQARIQKPAIIILLCIFGVANIGLFSIYSTPGSLVFLLLYPLFSIARRNYMFKKQSRLVLEQILKSSNPF